MFPLRRLFGVIALLAGAWTLALYFGYGQSLTLGPAKISSRNPVRPLLVCAAAAAGYALAGGWSGLRKDSRRLTFGAHRVARLGAGGFALVEARLNPAAVALLLVSASIAQAIWFRESTAGGSDAYSYVTQADLWIDEAPGMRIEMPIAAAAPWPDAIGTFTPFGYRPTPDRRAAVPVTAPGLPLLMAAFKIAFGHCAMFLVVPLSGGLLIWSTFAIGRRIVSDAVGLGAAWLVATSPIFLSMSKWVMSDVPAAALSMLAVSLLLRQSVLAAFSSGACASAAILTRPNLLPIGLLLGGWAVWREIRSGSQGRASRVFVFAAGVLPGCVAVAAVNHWLYGSPVSSGYGDLNSLFSLDHVALNVRRYTTWLADTQTPLALAGISALAVPSRRLWPTSVSRDAARLLALTLIVVVAVYAAYTPFEEWWYLRFLLPAWPAIAIGTSALIVGLTRHRSTWLRALSAVAIAWLGVRGFMTAQRLGVYPPGEGERRYATIATLVARATDPSSVIVTTAHVGPMRYYGGRLTVRYDVLDPAWLDRALEWFARQGRRPYILLEQQELPEFRQRFGAGSATGRLEMAPIMDYEAHRIGGRVYLFDPFSAAPETWKPAPIVDPRPRCPAPAARGADYGVEIRTSSRSGDRRSGDQEIRRSGGIGARQRQTR